MHSFAHMYFSYSCSCNMLWCVCHIVLIARPQLLFSASCADCQGNAAVWQKKKNVFRMHRSVGIFLGSRSWCKAIPYAKIGNHSERYKIELFNVTCEQQSIMQKRTFQNKTWASLQIIYRLLHALRQQARWTIIPIAGGWLMERGAADQR